MPAPFLRPRALAAALLLALPLASRAANTVVDILVVYTPAARAYAGGTNGMLAAINSHVALANTCYANSDVAVTLRLAAAAEVNYVETGSFNTDLVRLQNGADGYIDEVATLRDAYGADLVCLVRRDAAAGVAGLAYVGNATPSFAPYAYSVVADVWAAGNLAFPHELGHNFGSYHDRANSSGATHPYAYGWRFYGNDARQYITVMAYQPGSRIPYFSNPSILYQGQPTGVAYPAANAADNALLHDTNAAGTTAFRASSAPVGSGVRGDFNGDGKVDLVLSNVSTGARALWTFDGVSRTSVQVLPAGAAAWQIAAVADFNRDGHSDLIFQNSSTGGRSIWLMNGPARVSIVDLPAGLPAWRIGAAADFDGDGNIDLLFHNTADGRRSLWLMNGVTRTSVVDLPAGIASWYIAGADDFDSDGHPDILFQNVADGRRSLWLMNGVTRQSVVDFAPGLAAWRIAAAGDFNADGHPDIVFENISDGRHSLWLMNGVTRQSIVDLPAATAPWRIGNR